MSETDEIPTVVIAEEVRRDMERKLILVEDVERVVAHAEATGQKLKDRATGRFVASFRHGSQTFWVEYAADPGAAPVVHRAWAHRMNVEAAP